MKGPLGPGPDPESIGKWMPPVCRDVLRHPMVQEESLAQGGSARPRMRTHGGAE